MIKIIVGISIIAVSIIMIISGISMAQYSVTKQVPIEWSDSNGGHGDIWVNETYYPFQECGAGCACIGALSAIVGVILIFTGYSDIKKKNIPRFKVIGSPDDEQKPLE